MSRRWMWLALALSPLALARPDPVLVPQTGHMRPVSALALNTDGTWAASASEDGVIKMWRVASGEVWREWAGPRWTTGLAFSPDGRYLAANGPPTVRLWDVGSGKAVSWLPKVEFARGHLAFSPDGHWLAVGSTVVRLDPKRPRLFVACQLTKTDQTAFDRAGRYVTITGGDWTSYGAKYALRFDLATQRLVGRLNTNRLPDDSRLPQPGHRLLAVVRDKGPVGAVDVDTGQLLTLEVPSALADASRFRALSPDGRHLAYEVGPAAYLASLSGNDRAVHLKGAYFTDEATAFSGDGRRLLAPTYDGQAVFDTSTGERLASLANHQPPRVARVVRGGADRLCVWTEEQDLLWWDFGRSGAPRLRTNQKLPVVYQGDGNRLICQGRGSQRQSVDLTTGQITDLGGEADPSDNPANEPWPLGLSDDGRVAVSLNSGEAPSEPAPRLGRDAPAKPRQRVARLVWQAVPAEQAPQVLPLVGDDVPSRLLAVSGDGDLVALAWGDELGDSQASLGVASRRALRLLWKRSAYMDPRSAAFAPDGQTLTVSGQVGEFDDCQQVAVYGAADGRLQRWCAANDSAGNEFALSPDGRRAVTTGYEGHLRLWDLGVPRLLRGAEVATYAANRITYDPSGRWLLTDGDDLQVHDAETLALRMTLVVGPQGSGRWLAYTPDGRWDGSAQLPFALRYRVGDELVPASRYPNLHRRGLVRDILRP